MFNELKFEIIKFLPPFSKDSRATSEKTIKNVICWLEKCIITFNETKMFHSGASVVILGPPNAGKSTLFNCLVDRNQSIVTSVEGTTRDVIEKNTTVYSDSSSLTSYLTAIQHNNGIDWWVIQPLVEDSTFLTYLISENGIEYISLHSRHQTTSCSLLDGQQHNE